MDIESIVMKLMENEVSPEMLEIKTDLLRRLASEGDIRPARIPAPMNITEMGGYINLLRELNQEETLRQTRYEEMLRQALTSVLGLPVQAPK